MAAIKSLLNPMPELRDRTLQLPSPTSTVYAGDFSPPPQSRKKQKVSKDAAVFTRGPIRGECRFPPYEYRDALLAAHQQQYEIYPVGNIADYPRHIPYNSEKKSLLERTGRESFEVFHYNFKLPGQEKVHCMMWDYNIGLVRITSLFKSCGYSKTTPAKMLNRNPGLRDICHSITGGALVAQGYWIPYEAAKAIAATFCWSIRYALTPVFSADFPATCVPPSSDRYGEMIIDINITRRCAEEARVYRAMETRAPSRASSVMRSRFTPDSPGFPCSVKQLRPKALGIEGIKSGYSSDVESETRYSLTPTTPNLPYRNAWTPANTPRSVANHDDRLPSPRDIMASIAVGAGKNYGSGYASSSSSSSPPLSPKSCRPLEMEVEYDADSSSESSKDDRKMKLAAIEANSRRRKRSPSPDQSDEKAAYLLMGLSMRRGDTREQVKIRKRRAST